MYATILYRLSLILIRISFSPTQIIYPNLLLYNINFQINSKFSLFLKYYCTRENQMKKYSFENGKYRKNKQINLMSFGLIELS